MAGGLRLNAPASIAWWVVAVAFAGGALGGWGLPALRIDWQPALAASEPWRALSAAWVHWSALHLAANLAGTAGVALLGHYADLPRRAALAWLAAWPLTHLLLLAQPALAHYGGLSGVLHAGVAVAACWLCADGRRPQRRIGLAIGAGLLLKIGFERPWAGPLSQSAGWDIAIAPMAHAAGVLAGAACALVALKWRRQSSR